MTVPFTPAEVADVLAAARSAPSVHNSQPWRFVVAGDRVEVHADRDRALPAADPDGRQLLISCGAAVFALRVAVARLGSEPVTELVPDPGDPDHLATVARGAPAEATGETRSLSDMTRRRHTNRGPYRPLPVPPPVLRRLADAVAAESAVFRPVDSPAERGALAGLLLRGTAAQAGDTAARAEFLRSIRDEPEPATGMPAESWRHVPYPVPALDGDRPVDAERIAELAAHGTLAVLCTRGDGILDRLAAGQALQRMLLTATASGVAVSFLNQPVDRPELRPELAALLGGGLCPQMLLRAGYASRPVVRVGRR